jgi:hypothetical protein
MQFIQTLLKLFDLPHEMPQSRIVIDIKAFILGGLFGPRATKMTALSKERCSPFDRVRLGQRRSCNDAHPMHEVSLDEFKDAFSFLTPSGAGCGAHALVGP